jgi:hypothetical protein
VRVVTLEPERQDEPEQRARRVDPDRGRFQGAAIPLSLERFSHAARRPSMAEQNVYSPATGSGFEAFEDWEPPFESPTKEW